RGDQSATPDSFLGLARCRSSLHEVDAARQLLDEVLARQADHAAALLEHGRLAFQAGELTEAENWLRRAVAASPRCDCEPHRALCRCLEVGHKDEEARRCGQCLRERELEALRVDRQILQANREPGDGALRYAIALDLR